MGTKNIVYFNQNKSTNETIRILDYGYHETIQGHYSAQTVIDHYVLHCIVREKGYLSDSWANLPAGGRRLLSAGSSRPHFLPIRPPRPLGILLGRFRRNRCCSAYAALQHQHRDPHSPLRPHRRTGRADPPPHYSENSSCIRQFYGLGAVLPSLFQTDGAQPQYQASVQKGILCKPGHRSDPGFLL